MSGFALRDKARAYLARQNQTAASTALEDAQKELEILKAQVALLTSNSKPKMGRPKKED
jgi:hypothetical protein